MRIKSITVDGITYENEAVNLSHGKYKDSLIVLEFTDDKGHEWRSDPLTWTELADVLRKAGSQ